MSSRTVLFVVVSLERLLASFSKIAAGVSIVGALSAELHSATKAIVLPLCYVLGIPAIVLSVSQTEVLALEQFGQGIQDWDFLIIFGLPLLFVGLLSVFSFFAGVDQIKVTTEQLARIGVATPMINVARFIGLPFCYLTLSMALSVVFAVLSSTLHLAILGSSLGHVMAGISLKVSFSLAGVLFAAFLVCTGVYLTWGAVGKRFAKVDSLS